MNLKDKTIYIPEIVPGVTEEEVIDNVVKVIIEIETPRERHILRYCKRARIRKKYIDRLTRDALIVILLRRIFNEDNVSGKDLLYKIKRGDLNEFASNK